MRVLSALICVPLLASVATAQDPMDQADRARTVPVPPAIPTVPMPVFTPLTVAEKYRHNLYRTFDGYATLRTFVSTGVDLALDNPEPWPSGMEGYGIRLASKVGRRLNKRMMMATVQSVMGHDPRRIRSTATGFWPRAGQAVLNTYRSRKDDGGVTFNYSRVIAAYGSGFVSRSWHPPGRRSSRDAWINGTNTLIIDGATSILWEFWPEIRRTVLRRR